MQAELLPYILLPDGEEAMLPDRSSRIRASGCVVAVNMSSSAVAWAIPVQTTMIRVIKTAMTARQSLRIFFIVISFIGIPLRR